MSRVGTLWQLQAVDLALAEAGKRLLAARAQVGETQELLETRQAVNTGGERLHQLRASARAAELELASLDTKIAEINGRLYSGRVTNPKELASLQQDLVFLKRRQSELEDGILETMTEIEAQESSLQSDQSSLATLQDSWASDQTTLTQTIHALETQMRALGAQRAEIAAQVNADDMMTYAETRRRKGGVAVTLLRGDLCESCHVSVPPAKKQRMRSNAEMIQCDGCGRIIYYAE